jgi:hypothetical protein
MKPARMLALLAAVLITAFVIVMITNDMFVAQGAAVASPTPEPQSTATDR